MESVKTQSTLYFISVIAKLSGEIDYDDFKQKTENINQIQDYIKTIKDNYQIKCKNKHQRDKSITKLPSPTILYDNNGHAFLLANHNQEQVLIQRFGHPAPEIWSHEELQKNWNGNWLHVKVKQGKFDISWF
ncbi:peptidase, C39 family [Providencia alcalifaciens PAL-3]|nr:peptidase, C39 family [Providencia alcalifaciens PAL-3]EUD00099.1 peptidase, C39 family [Providencia alcalifaciens PAL-1]